VKPTVHLVCNAHLDPVWQWRWDEGASEALATFRNAVDILDEHPGLIFCHNEAVLYQWVERFDPALFDDIRRLVKAGRWAISGGWFIQPDVNLPGTESLVRSIAEGRRYFRDRFDAAPRVAYNFDSFGHSGGLPQILRQAGYEMYVHMRPQADDLALPADLYRWRGVDGTVIPAYRIAVGLYHTEHDNVEDRLRAGVELALELGRDVPVFWGLGNHGGGATRRDLATIDAFIARESRVRIVHSTPDRFCEAVRDAAASAPIVDGDLERCFTGCYTSLSRLKRQAVASLGRLVQAETAAAAASWLAGSRFSEAELREAWNLHLFNDFHDILPGSCVEPAERDALAVYGAAESIARRVALGAVAALNRGSHASPPLPVTVFNANPCPGRVPVEFECMADHRPFWKGTWRMRLVRADGREVVCQEEQPESLLPFNNWRRRISFVDEFPGIGVSRYELRAYEVREDKERGHVPSVDVSKSSKPGLFPRSPLARRVDPKTGLVASLRPAGSARSVAGPFFEPLVIEDLADSWGTGHGSYRKIVGRFKLAGPPSVIEQGPVRTITRSVFVFSKSRLVMDVTSYPTWPVLEFRFRITWNEERRRLKLALPTRLAGPSLLVEVPGGAIERPADGEEHVHGRWLVISGTSAGKAAAIGVASSGQHGLDFKDGELRLSVLRSSAYCHERSFDLGTGALKTGTVTSSCPQWKFADIGVHEFRLLVMAGGPAAVKAMMPGLADHLAAPPAAYSHLPYDAESAGPAETLLSVKPANVRLLACKLSWDGQALVVRLQEATGKKTKAVLNVAAWREPGAQKKERGHAPSVHVPLAAPLAFAPFEIKTLRVSKDGRVAPVRLIEETLV
jgi:alpha-mannosidase